MSIKNRDGLTGFILRFGVSLMYLRRFASFSEGIVMQASGPITERISSILTSSFASAPVLDRLQDFFIEFFYSAVF